MTQRLRSLSALFLVAAVSTTARLDAQRPSSGSRGALARGTLAITNVSVIPMTRDTVLTDATILVRDGRIVSVGPTRSVQVPNGARRIDGRGKFAIPGLADMHTHLFSDSEVPDSIAPYELGLMVANGITATRFMMGTPEQLALRQDVAAGKIVGPQLWVASPEFAGRRYGGEGFHGKAIPTPEDARAAVREIAAQGYDFIKITLFVETLAFDALADEAKKHGIRLVGHVDPRVGVPHALAAGQHIEHLDNYMEQVLADSAPTKASVSDRGVYSARAWESLDHVDDAKVRRIAGVTARSGTFTTPTLTIFRNAFAVGVPDSVLRRWPDWNVYPPHARTLWLGAMDKYWTTPALESRRRRWTETRYALVKAIADSGGRIMAGSDSPEFLHSYGYTLHRELESLVAAGLTPYQALAAATRTPAAFLNASSEWGTIAPGRRADLVLLSANPLADIRNTTRIDGVALGGRWFDAADLTRMTQAATSRLQAAGQ